MTDVDYTFYERPKFLSPKANLENVNIDESESENIKPSDDLLNKVASKFSPKRQSFRSVFINSKPSFKSLKSPKRRRRSKSPKRKKSKSPKKSPKRRRSKKISPKRNFGLQIMSGMGGLAYSN